MKHSTHSTLMRKLALLLALFLLPALAHAQYKEFSAVARVADSLMIEDYKAKDPKQYIKHMAMLQAAYNKLSAKDKDAYKGEIKGAWYNLACTYSLMGNKQLALDALAKAQYEDYEHLLEDTDLDNIRKEPAFAKIAQEVKARKPKVLLLLQHEGAYGKPQQKVPAFTYQSQEDAHLQELRKIYNLDSIAGTGNEVSRMLNLMHWVHNSVAHDGSNGIPDGRNAMNLLKLCTQEGKTCNCRGLAIILNEVYLATGFKSRYVTCMPKDTADQDCHVINAVYSKSLGHWVWIDPTFDAYIMSETGELLGPKEVRDRLMHDKPLILNPEANWNHRSTQSQRYYLNYYMAKNLYRMECPLASEYWYENWKDGKQKIFVELRPTVYTWNKNTNTNPNFKNYYTTIESDFWAKPE